MLDTGIYKDVAVVPPAGPPPPHPTALTAARARLARITLIGDPDHWDVDGNKVLDPFAGHGTFIAGLIANLAPGAHVDCERALTSFGDTDDVVIARSLTDKFAAAGKDPYDIVSMSFGGFCEEDDPPIAIARAISQIQATHRTASDLDDPPELINERVVFVGSAGNDASCRPTWPASFENVIAVGALGPAGPAWFTNYGPWVDACAPGVDIVSTFFDLSDQAAFDGEDFDGWATWSGTSFSAPIVAASIAWEWMTRGGREMLSPSPELGVGSGRPGHAATWLLDRPGHFRQPGLGTVVNPH